MDEAKVKEKIKDVILESNCMAFTDLTFEQYFSILAQCIKLTDVDWLFDRSIMDKIFNYIISATAENADDLAQEIRNSLANYYDVHIEELFNDALSEIHADPEN
jgi:hypothetical protein